MDGELQILPAAPRPVARQLPCPPGPSVGFTAYALSFTSSLTASNRRGAEGYILGRLTVARAMPSHLRQEGILLPRPK